MNENDISGKSTVTLKNREELIIDGVTDVISFDDSTVYLNTENGKLLIEGNGLHISTLDVASGYISVNGYLLSFEYNDKDNSKKSGLFKNSK